MKTISVISAKYIGDFKLEIFFEDKKKTIVDFDGFLSSNYHPQYNKYKKEDNFKKFRIENGNLVWGKNWDLIFPVWELYKGKLKN